MELAYSVGQQIILFVFASCCHCFHHQEFTRFLHWDDVNKQYREIDAKLVHMKIRQNVQDMIN